MSSLTLTNSYASSVNDESNKFVKGLDKVADGARAVKDSTEGLYATLQTTSYLLMGGEALFGASKPVTTTLMHMSASINVIDFMEIFSVTNYMVSGAAVEDCKRGFFCRFFGSISFAFGTIGGIALWLAELGFYNLGKAAAALGSIPVIGVVAVIPLLPLVCATTALGYALFAAHSVQNLLKAKNKHQVIKGLIDIISRVANVALFVLIPIPGINLPAVIVLGIIAKGLGLVSFLYEHYNKQAFA